jgi:hypothetical protein
MSFSLIVLRFESDFLGSPSICEVHEKFSDSDKSCDETGYPRGNFDTGHFKYFIDYGY